MNSSPRIRVIAINEAEKVSLRQQVAPPAVARHTVISANGFQNRHRQRRTADRTENGRGALR